jgi:hypothetical protein
MKQHSVSSTSAFSHAGLLPALCSFLAAGATLAVSLERRGELRADAVQMLDRDGDGLVDAAEHVLGTSPTNVDTDRDGYSDLEELARHTSPLLAQSLPSADARNAPSLGMSCYWSHGRVHALIAVYSPDSNFHDLTMHIGYLANGRLGELGESALVGHAAIHTHPAHDPAASIAVLDFPFSPRAVHALGGLTVFATAGRVGSGVVSTADSIQLLDVGGVVVLCKVDNSTQMNAATVGGGHAHGASAMIYVPLGDDDMPPMNWVSGAICYQQMEVVATTHASVTQEVVSAECQDGWDGACPSSCSSSVGSLTTTIDAAALIGG